MSEYYDSAPCGVCGCELDYEDCWYCHGEGGFHDCMDDTCCCLYKDEITVDCPVCAGTGRLSFCPDAKNHPTPARQS